MAMYTLKEKFLFEATVKKLIRRFFETKNFTEISIPVLNAAVPLEPTITPFSTTWYHQQGSTELFMSTSPEKNMKKALASGLELIFGFGQSFRNLEASGDLHQPEFTMLEWYRPSASTTIMADLRELVDFLRQELDAAIEKLEWQTLSLDELFLEYTGYGLKALSDDKTLISLAEQKGYATANATWEQLFNQIFLNEIESRFPKTPFFLVDFPARISPLCAPLSDKPYLADRFEAYINGIELANGNGEPMSAAAVAKSIETETQTRQSESSTPQADQEFLTTLKQLETQQFAGVGLGVDRLLLILSHQTELAAIRPIILS